MTLLEAALQYAAHGFRVFPCAPRGKQPITAHGVKDATTDPVKIAEWWLVNPEANIGVATGGGRWVLDLDDADARMRLEAAGVALPTEGWIATTGKGAHVWFTGDVGNRTKVVDKVDVRGDGGYVVAPPSIHPNGGTYAWVDGLPFDRPLPAPPPALAAMVASKSTAPRATEHVNGWVEELLDGVGEGGRDDACTRLAGYFLGKGLPVGVVESLLQGWADRCTPPFPSDQVSKCVQSIATREGEVAPDTVPPAAPELVDKAIELIRRPVRNVRKTGLDELDELFDGGLEPGTVTLIGARPGVGKTALMLQMARDMAAHVGVLFVTLEMSPTRLMRRVLSQASQVRFENLKTGDLTAGEWAALTLAANVVRTLPLYVDNRVHTVEALDGLLDAFAAGQVGVVMVDSLQKLGPPDAAASNPRAAAEHVVKALTRFAVRRDLPVIAASMLSRPDRTDKNWRPQMSNLRESAVLEHEADNVLLLHREEGDAKLEAFLRKHRDGEVGETVLGFDGPTLTVRGNAAA